jgi:hypothetical protein
MIDIKVLAPFVDEDPRDFRELEASCGRFIDAWIEADGLGTDDAVVAFYSLWAQSLDSRGKDEADYFDWAYPQFIQARDVVRASLRSTLPHDDA